MTARPSEATLGWVPPSALPARVVAAVGVLLALSVLLVVCGYLIQGRKDKLETQRDRIELMSRVLEDHATRSIDTAAVALSTLGEVVSQASPQGADVYAALAPVLQQSLAGLPVVRGVAVMDLRGHVLAATDPALPGRTLALRTLGALPAAGSDSLGPFVPGRGLDRLIQGGEAGAAPAGLGFLPLLRRVRLPDTRELLLVAVVNPDAIANYQQQLVADQRAAVLLTSLSGRVLASTEFATLLPGDSAATLPVFTLHLPAQEHAEYQGAGSRPGDQLVAFRATRTRPLVVVVESAVDDALQPWRREAAWLGSAGVLAALVVLVMTWLSVRSLQSRELVRAQRDAAQAEVQRREAELSVVVASVQELLFRTDQLGRLVYVNPRWPQATGLPMAEALGRPLAQLVQPESAGAARQLFAPDGGDGEIADVRAATLRLGLAHERREYDVAVVPLREAGRITGFAGSAIDVTAQRQAQGRLTAQLSFTELLLDMLPLPMSIRDMEDRFVSVNQAWQAFTGRRREAVLGQPAWRFLTEADAQQHSAKDHELVARGGRLRYEASVTTPDGTRRDVVLTKALVPGDEGQAAGIITLMLDVTELREAERATREARDAAEEASRAKTEFIGTISHELRTPLQSIIGFSELGQARAGEAQKLGSMFGDIHAAGQRMLALVNDLLDVAKIESTVGTFHLERIDLRALVHDVVAELMPLIHKRGLALQMDLGEQALVAKVDPQRFQQVVRNVLANAVRFSPPGAPLVLRGGFGHDGHIHLTVRDQGPGIPPSELEQIFEAFVQSSATKDGAGGTGLGLTISRKIVQAHDGRIWASNNHPALGATFHIALPATRGKVPTQSQQ